MADNITLNSGTGGDTLAADDISGVKYQRVKPTFGEDGSATDVSNTTPLPTVSIPESGRVFNGTTELTVKYASVSSASSGNNTLVSGVGGKKIRVLALVLYGVGSAVNVYIKDDAGTPKNLLGDSSGLLTLDKTGVTGPAAIVLNYNQSGWFETTASAALILNLSAAQRVAGCVTYVEV